MTTEPPRNRLFVPLSSEPFNWFRSGQKRWELRRYGRQYTPAHLTPGRRVELRRGYRSQEDALWGRVAHMVEATSLAAFFEKVPFHLVIPIARSREEAL
jgi:hypothetical protein